MTSTEEKLARELALEISRAMRIKIHNFNERWDCTSPAHPSNEQWLNQMAEQDLKIILPILEKASSKLPSSRDLLTRTVNYDPLGNAPLVELTEQRKRGGGSLSPREWLDARYGSTPPVGEWQWTDEIVEAYASSRLAEVTRTLEYIGDPSDKKVLQALIEDYQKAVDDSGQHHLIAPENVKERFERLKGERDALALQLKTGKHFNEASKAVERAEKRQDELQAALSQAQQALRHLVSEASGFVSMASIGNHGITNMRVLEAKIEDARKVLAALPSDAPPSSELNLPCLACGKPKNDSTMHHDAPGKNWGAALHWFEAPPSDAPEATKGFEIGQRVRVDHPRFHGFGKFQYEKPRVIGVLLENGNTWEYEYETVKLPEAVSSDKETR